MHSTYVYYYYCQLTTLIYTCVVAAGARALDIVFDPALMCGDDSLGLTTMFGVKPHTRVSTSESDLLHMHEYGFKCACSYRHSSCCPIELPSGLFTLQLYY